MSKINKKLLLLIWLFVVILSILSLTILQYNTLSEYNEIQAYRSSRSLITEAEQIIAGNDQDRDELQEFLKYIYLDKAREVSYIIDSIPELETEPDGLRELAKTMEVDQIHLFDECGTIYGSTESRYIGLTMEAGDQIRFFKPMLLDRALCMSQDILPNTAEGKNMLYAMCWNKTGTHMVQVGAAGSRFPRILERNRIEMFINMIPDDPERDIILTDAHSDRIIACTNQSYVGQDLYKTGIEALPDSAGSLVELQTGFSDNPIYCSFQEYQDYRVIIAQYRNQINKNIPISLISFTEYLILVFIAITFVLDFLYDKFTVEKSHAMKDGLTELYNRRAYETRIARLEQLKLDEDLVYVSMDVNGLKTTNDTMGHEAGDLLLRGAVSCMQRCFGAVGDLYRYGGDEFVALIRVKSQDLPQLEARFNQLCQEWSEENGMALTVSLGFAKSVDHPQGDIHLLASNADREMYAAKARFYAVPGQDRRSGNYENQ